MSKKLVVTASALNLRENPSLESQVVAILDRGDVVESLEASPGGSSISNVAVPSISTPASSGTA